MKHVCFTLLTLFASYTSLVSAQSEKEIKTTIENVTVYSSGAQIERKAVFELLTGKTKLTFTGLSPYINAESIRVDGDGRYTILNVQLENDYLNELEKTKEINDLNTSIQKYRDLIEDEETWIKILNEKIDFLKSNRTITGKEQAVDPEVFKTLNSLYGENFEKYSLDLVKRKRQIKTYTTEVDKLTNQLNTLNNRSELPSGKITVVVNSKKIQQASLNLVYLVENARWYPTFDIRFIDVNKPLSISYKANISQQTGVDWKETNLVLSTAKTNVSAQIPTLVANYLQFYYPPVANTPLLRKEVSQLSNVTYIEGMKVRGSATTENSAEPMYVIDGVVANDASHLNPDDIQTMDVLKGEAATAIYGSRGADGVIIITTKQGAQNLQIPLTATNRNETAIEHIVDDKQTIVADNNVNTLTFREAELKATYEYQTIPKLSKNVYLVAKVADWFKADLMDGEASIYMQNSFVGISRINTQQFTDTLDISFGIDNNISVNREKIKDFTQSEFIGSNKKDTYAFKLTLRNNKPFAVKVKLIDQVPVSSTKEIEVEPLELSGGQMNKNTGKVVWIIELMPNETRQVILKYSIRLPKDKVVLGE